MHKKIKLIKIIVLKVDDPIIVLKWLLVDLLKMVSHTKLAKKADFCIK